MRGLRKIKGGCRERVGARMGWVSASSFSGSTECAGVNFVRLNSMFELIC